MEQYVRIAERTGKFKPAEIEVLREVLIDWKNRPEAGYHLLEEVRGGVCSGFIIFGRTEMTDNGWDLFWIAVDPGLQRAGIGAALLEKMYAFMRAEGGCRAVIRVETAGKAEYEATRNFYLKHAYHEAGRLKDFYADGDDLVLYSRTIVF